MSGVKARRPHNQRGARGAILVEAAIVLPLALFIIAGILDLGHIFRRGTIIYQASRAGARTAGAMTTQSDAQPGWWCAASPPGALSATQSCTRVLAQNFNPLPPASHALPLKSGMYMACHYLQAAGLNPQDWEATVSGPLLRVEDSASASDLTQMRLISVTVRQSPGSSRCLFCFQQQLGALILEETSFFPVQCAN